MHETMGNAELLTRCIETYCICRYIADDLGNNRASDWRKEYDALRAELLRRLEAGAQAQAECERLKAENAEYAQLVSVDIEPYLGRIERLKAENAELRALVLEARECVDHENAPHPADACPAWWDHFGEPATDICKCWYGSWAERTDKALEGEE